jgi:hypothetical protein
MWIHLGSCHLNLENTCKSLDAAAIPGSGPNPYSSPNTTRRTYTFHCVIHAPEFMAWTMDELRPVTLDRLKKAKGNIKATAHSTIFHIPAAYHQIVCQLVAEIDLGKRTSQHEVRRRETYAREVLDAFGRELEGFRSFSKPAMVGFRSAVLTPILQRQLSGVPDAYTPSVHRAIMGSRDKPTIEAATRFYLSDDPTDPENIPNYRRNLLSVQEARWHLGRVLGNAPPLAEDEVHVEYYNRFLEDHDSIMAAINKHGYEGYNEDGIPYLTQVERSAIERERLELFFVAELAAQVRHAHLPHS